MPTPQTEQRSDPQQGREQQNMVRVTLRPIASALPLGCFAFGIGNVLLSALSLHWLPLAESSLVASILLAFVAPLELIPCILAYLARDTGGATAMGIFSMSWIVQAVELLRSPTQPPSPTAGLFLALLALCLAVLTAASFPAKPLLGVLLSIALLRSAAAATVSFGVHAVAPTAAILGLLLAAFAFYSGLGFLLEDVRGAPLPMTFRRGDAKAAMEGDMHHQIERVFTEAGVRQQL